MKRIIFILVVLGVILVTQQVCFAGDLTIGYISLSNVFKDYKKVEDSNAKLEERKNQVKAKLTEMQDLKKNYDSLSEKGKKELEDKLMAKQEDIRKDTLEVRKDEDRVLREILQDIEKAAGDLRKDRKLTYILDDRLIIAGPDDMDVTGDIVKILNERYK
ncbi:MAG: OmpH family outer membrane protein [Candidatus Omnitrophota bacterium]